ncbi:MAG TPA: histidinol dehydrogenase [Candidatus Tectomicrobia bacterium]|nr:histidinol dehydrogenase [Candidatus Tectomicrobia bacterium]
MRIVHGAEEGRRTLLRRQPLGETELPAAVRAKAAEVHGGDLSVEQQVRRILGDVAREGDAAVRRYTEAFAGVTVGALECTRDEIARAYDAVDAALVDALRAAADRIRDYHRRQLEHSSRTFSHEGVGMQVRPIARVGMYVPTSRGAVYPSSVLMTGIPARVAGVRELIMCSPAAPDGTMAALKLVAADIAGVDRVFKAGGAEAIAAMAYGTETIPRVDKIVGPGNIFVTVAKREVFGPVGIDALYGPSETIVIADETADPMLAAADLLAQAEHDELATPILLTTSAQVAEAVAAEVERQLRLLDREQIARTSFDARGGAVIVGSVDEAVALADEYAPEHLCLLVKDAAAVAATVQNAGGIFVGDEAPESLGDYTAGPSHVMPTAGAARYASPLGVHDFVKVSSVVAVGPGVLKAAGVPAAAIARAEGFTAHARSIELRLHGGEFETERPR